MRSSFRAKTVLAVLPGALLAVALAFAAGACGTDAVGIDACRKIETCRCKAAPTCLPKWTEADVTSCISLYRDQCLHGLENTDDTPKTSDVDACIDAINGVVACKQAGAATMAQCTGVPLVGGRDPAGVDTCHVILATPEVLARCGFLTPTPDAGAPVSDAGSTSDAGDGGDGS